MSTLGDDTDFANENIDDLIEYDEENGSYCESCGGNGMYFEGDVHMGDCPDCCGGTL